VNIQIPYETSAGWAILGVNNNGNVASYWFQVAASAPAIFADQGGSLPSSAPGQGATLRITGDGDALPALLTGATPAVGTANLPKPRLPVTVTVGGTAADVQSVGIHAGNVGITQIDFMVPQSAPTGVQPVVVTVGGVASPPVNLTVAP
jgi:uncharacterized protein (TIGR03437 family)